MPLGHFHRTVEAARSEAQEKVDKILGEVATIDWP
jgi:hypothetical protein